MTGGRRPRSAPKAAAANGRAAGNEIFDGVPKPLLAKRPLFLTFTDLTEEAMDRLDAAETKSEVRQILKECMKIDQAEGFRTEILADMHYHNYSFCMARDFSPDKTSTLLSIMRLVLEEAVSRRLVLDKAFDVFKEWLLKHGVARPPYSVGVFAYDDVKVITEYAHETFFRHYHLYMYVYMMHCDIDFQVDDSDRGAIASPLRPAQLRVDCEVDDPRSVPELAHLFRPSETEQLEESLRKIRESGKPEDKQAIIKRKVEEGVKRLVESFETKVKDQETTHKERITALNP